MQTVFEEHNIPTILYPIERSDPSKLNPNHTIGLGFPIAELSTYYFIWDFIKSLPSVQNTEIFMVDTLAGFSGGIVGPLRRILTRKGYTPLGAQEIIMPPNIFYVQDADRCREKIKEGLKKAEEYAESLINGTSKWGRVPLISDLIYYFSLCSLRLTKSKLQQKMLPLRVDISKCRKCGICANLCPVNNITRDQEKYPVHDFKCEYCLRCTSFCPIKAISCPFNYKGRTYRAVKAKELLL